MSADQSKSVRIPPQFFRENKMLRYVKKKTNHNNIISQIYCDVDYKNDLSIQF